MEKYSVNPDKSEAEVVAQVARIADKLKDRAKKLPGTGIIPVDVSKVDAAKGVMKETSSVSTTDFDIYAPGEGSKVEGVGTNLTATSKRKIRNLHDRYNDPGMAGYARTEELSSGVKFGPNGALTVSQDIDRDVYGGVGWNSKNHPLVHFSREQGEISGGERNLDKVQGILADVRGQIAKQESNTENQKG